MATVAGVMEMDGSDDRGIIVVVLHSPRSLSVKLRVKPHNLLGNGRCAQVPRSGGRLRRVPLASSRVCGRGLA